MRSLAIHSLLIGAALGIALPRGDNGCLRGRAASVNGVVAHDCNVNARGEASTVSPDTSEKNKRAGSRVEFVTLHPSVTVRVNGSRPVTEPKPAPGEQKQPISAPVKVTQPIQPPALKQPSSIPSSAAAGAQPFRTLTPLPNSPPLGKAPPIQPPAVESKTTPQPSLIALPPPGSPAQGLPQPPSAVKPQPDQKLPPVAPSKPSIAPQLPVAPPQNTEPLIQPTGASGGVGVTLVPLPANHRPTTTFSIDPLTSAVSIPVQAPQKSASSRLPESPISAPPAQKQPPPPPPPPPQSVPTSVSKALPSPPPPVKETSSALVQPPPAKETSSTPVPPPAKETPSAPIEPPPAKVSSSTSSSKEAAKPSKPAETSAQSTERATSSEPSPTPTPTLSSSSEEPKSSRRPKNTTTIFTAITPSKVSPSVTETSAEAGASSTESAAKSNAEGASTSSLTTASPTGASNITLSQTSLDRSGPTAIQSLTFHSAIDLGPARATGTKTGLVATTTSVVFASPMIMSLDLTKYTLVSQLQLGALGAPANPTPI